MGVILASTTSPQEELEHGVSENWREPFVPKPAEEAPKPEGEEPEVPAEEAPKAEEKPKGHKGGGPQKRIDKLTARNAALEKELEEYKAKVKPADEKKPEAPREPKLADFGNDVEKFVAARDEWKKAEEVRIATEETQKVIFDAYNKKVSEARGQYDDWDEVVSSASNVSIPQSAYVAIVESENGPDVAYYLATHPEEATPLVDMTPTAAVRAIGKISDKLIAEKSKPPVKEKVKPPDPVSPVGASSTRTNLSLDELSPREYIRVRNKQERENRMR